MVAVRNIDDTMFPEIYATFLENDDRLLQEADWKRLFVNSPGSTARRNGFALLAESRIVGILGALCSDRWVDGTWHRFCNLHSWYVLPDYRGYSLFMLQKAIADRDTTITDFTPTPLVTEISQRMGLEPLNARLRVLLPWNVSRRTSTGRLTLIHDVKEIGAQLDEPYRRLLQDHTGAPCRHLFVLDGERSCYVSYSRVDRWRIPYCYIHHVSDRNLFSDHHAAIRRALCVSTSTRLVALDARQMPHCRIPWSIELPVGSAQLYRSRSVTPDRIDSMYSELALLSLTTFPDLSAALAAFCKKWRLKRSSS